MNNANNQNNMMYSPPNPNQFASKGDRAVGLARSTSDYAVLTITIIILFLISNSYLIIEFFMDEETQKLNGFAEYVVALLFLIIGGAFFFGIIVLSGMFMVRMHRQRLLGNALHVECSNYAWLRDWAAQVAADLRMPHIEIFITQDPVMNAYALGFIRPYNIVLHSGSIRYLTKKELKAVVVHEMAHIKYGHTTALVFLRPFLAIPVVNVVGEWIIGFWSRRSELTADRLALAYMGDVELVKKALIKMHVGPDAAGGMDEKARQWLSFNAEKRPMNRFAQTFASHPFLVRRLSHLDRWNYIIQQHQ